MAKKQTYGEKALASKLSQRKMAKVIVSVKSEIGTYNYRESMVEVDKVGDFVKKFNR
jgi:hypothetical protein